MKLLCVLLLVLILIIAIDAAGVWFGSYQLKRLNDHIEAIRELIPMSGLGN